MIAARKWLRIVVGGVATLMMLMVGEPQWVCAADAVAAATAADKALLATLLQRLRQHDAVKVPFTQQKTLHILKRPLQSEGSLLFWRGHGMVWRVTAPVAATYVLNAQGMREVGGATPPSTNSSMPNLLPLFDAIFAGDEVTLAQHFDYHVAGSAQQWQLTLTPRDDMLLRVFNRLELTGRDYIDSITLFDTRGDQTRIELHQPQFGSEGLSADEHALLP
jgi:hypothetical protein